MQKSDVNYRKVFKDIAVGFSIVEINGLTAYLKHISPLDQIDIEEVQQAFFEKARKRGLPTEKECLKRLEEEELWGKKEEREIKEQEAFIENCAKTKKQMFLKADIEAANKSIEEARAKLFILRNQKDQLLGQTCEKYSQNRVSDIYIIKSLFRDEQLRSPLYSKDEVDELGREELLSIIRSYNRVYSSFSDKNIRNIVVQDFFESYLYFSDDPKSFFNRAAIDLSLNQLNLINYCKIFKNIFENYPKIPDGIKRDADKIIDYVNAQEKAKKHIEKVNQDGASTIVGATKEDYEYVGVKQSSNSLTEALKKKGGKMNMQDMMDAMS